MQHSFQHRGPLKSIDNMARGGRKASARRGAPAKKQLAKTSSSRGRKRKTEDEEDDDYSSDEAQRTMEELSEMEEEEDADSDPQAKIAELQAQLKAVKSSKAIVPLTLSKMLKTNASKTLVGVMKKELVFNWWGQQPFINNEKSLSAVCDRLYKVMMPKDHADIKEEVAKQEAKDNWIATYRYVIRQLLNQIRNYFQGQLRKVWLEHAVQEVKKIPPAEIEKAKGEKDKDGQDLGLVDKDGFPTAKFVLTRVKTLITWQEVLKVVSRDANFLKTPRGIFVSGWWWNDALPKLAGRCHWGDNKPYLSTISGAEHPNNEFWDNNFPAVPYPLEAVGVLFMENAEGKWPTFVVKNLKDPNWKYDPKADYMECPYSTSKEGGRVWGAFTVKGMKRYATLKDLAKKGRTKTTCEASEKAILKRLRIKHGFEDENGEIKKADGSKKKAKKVDPLEEQEQDEDDLF